MLLFGLLREGRRIENWGYVQKMDLLAFDVTNGNIKGQKFE
jgi:hypothetical protein